MKLSRLVRTAFLPFLAAATFAAVAADFPTDTVKIVAPFPPGGSTDLYARAVSESLGRAWNHTVIVENKPGASGMIGAGYVARSKPDGHTLVIGAASLHTILPLLNEGMAQTQANLVPVSLLGVNPSYVVVPTSVPVNTIQELVAYLKKAPGKHPYASAGAGTSQHVFVELFMQMTGTEMYHVPYKGSGQMVTDLMAGRVVMGIEQGPAVMSHIKSGRLKALAVTTPKRSLALPDVPTVAETIAPGFEASTWFALYAPAGTPKDVIEKISRAVGEGFKSEDIRKTMLNAGVEPQTSTPAEMKKIELRDTAKWTEVVKKADIRLQ